MLKPLLIRTWDNPLAPGATNMLHCVISHSYLGSGAPPPWKFSGLAMPNGHRFLCNLLTSLGYSPVFSTFFRSLSWNALNILPMQLLNLFSQPALEEKILPSCTHHAELGGSTLPSPHIDSHCQVHPQCITDFNSLTRYSDTAIDGFRYAWMELLGSKKLPDQPYAWNHHGPALC
ncbi:hypothetical protein Hypma_004837 [Hypsizygus marmoreus]|uniref:Uncharacterized protein n=1 Tax=Hypsizygus marmoreus TaxID=39966 RepID=A0A369J6V1_HYPMA|nr:hypothetical protein Hypma_004837 [Hypsizygus marmoreus]